MKRITKRRFWILRIVYIVYVNMCILSGHEIFHLNKHVNTIHNIFIILASMERQNIKEQWNPGFHCSFIFKPEHAFKQKFQYRLSIEQKLCNENQILCDSSQKYRVKIHHYFQGRVEFFNVKYRNSIQCSVGWLFSCYTAQTDPPMQP